MQLLRLKSKLMLLVHITSLKTLVNSEQMVAISLLPDGQCDVCSDTEDPETKGSITCPWHTSSEVFSVVQFSSLSHLRICVLKGQVENILAVHSLLLLQSNFPLSRCH